MSSDKQFKKQKKTFKRVQKHLKEIHISNFDDEWFGTEKRDYHIRVNEENTNGIDIYVYDVKNGTRNDNEEEIYNNVPIETFSFKSSVEVATVKNTFHAINSDDVDSVSMQKNLDKLYDSEYQLVGNTKDNNLVLIKKNKTSIDWVRNNTVEFGKLSTDEMVQDSMLKSRILEDFNASVYDTFRCENYYESFMDYCYFMDKE